MYNLDLVEKERRALMVADDHDGIHPLYESFYLHSIIYSADRCIHAFSRYDYLRSQNIDTNPDTLISLIQEAVGHAAALSRYFYPTAERKDKRLKEPNQVKLKEKRGLKLRQAFDINKSSSLYNRDLRNAWEHFDESLDKYLLENATGFFSPNCQIGSHLLADDSLGHIFKLLDPEVECLVLMGTKYFFSPIRDDVNKIFEYAQEASNNKGRFKMPSE